MSIFVGKLHELHIALILYVGLIPVTLVSCDFSILHAAVSGPGVENDTLLSSFVRIISLFLYIPCDYYSYVIANMNKASLAIYIYIYIFRLNSTDKLYYNIGELITELY